MFTQHCNRILTPHSRHESPDLHVSSEYNSATGYIAHSIHWSPDTCVLTIQQCNRILTPHGRCRSPDLHMFTQHNSATGYPPHTVDTGVQTYMCSHNTTVQQDTQPTQQTEESRPTCVHTTQQCNRIPTPHSRHGSPDLHVFTQHNSATGYTAYTADRGVQPTCVHTTIQCNGMLTPQSRSGSPNT